MGHFERKFQGEGGSFDTIPACDTHTHTHTHTDGHAMMAITRAELCSARVTTQYGVCTLACFSNDCVNMYTWLTVVGHDDS